MDDDMIYSIARRAAGPYLRVHPHENSDEVMSAAFLGIALGLRKIDTTRSQGEQDRYLCQKAQFAIIDSWRHRNPGCRTVHGIPLAPVSLDAMADSDAGRRWEPTAPGREFNQAEARIMVDAAFESLTERERGILTATIGYGYTVAEVGERLGIDPTYVCRIRAAALRTAAA